MNFIINYFKYKSWLRDSLENSAISIIDYALREKKEHEFLDFKRDFYINREFQRDKSRSEELTKENIRMVLEKYAVGFSNLHGGFLLVGFAQHKKSFLLQGINYKNIKRKKLLIFLKEELKRIKEDLKIDCSFVSVRVKYKEVFVFKFNKTGKQNYFTSNGKYFIRKKDQTLDITRKINKENL